LIGKFQICLASNELTPNPDLRQKVAATSWQVMQFLAVMTGTKEGAVPISEAAQALLGGGPAV
jgi:hypothetical protein